MSILQAAESFSTLTEYTVEKRYLTTPASRAIPAARAALQEACGQLQRPESVRTAPLALSGSDRLDSIIKYGWRDSDHFIANQNSLKFVLMG